MFFNLALLASHNSNIAQKPLNKNNILSLSDTLKDIKLSEDEIRERGIDLRIKELMKSIKNINMYIMARSFVFETSYGFRWKLLNLKTNDDVTIKVTKDFELISIE